MPRLRIVAPHTPQRTSFQEDGCPYAWPVIDGISLNVKDNHWRTPALLKIPQFCFRVPDQYGSISVCSIVMACEGSKDGIDFLLLGR